MADERDRDRDRESWERDLGPRTAGAAAILRIDGWLASRLVGCWDL